MYYHVFAYDCNPEGGLEDYKKSFETLEEAKQEAHENYAASFDMVEIIIEDEGILKSIYYINNA